MPAGPAGPSSPCAPRETALNGLNGVADGGALAMTATGATFAALSLSAMSWFPLIVTPPLATPPSTVRVSVTATVSPLLVESCVSMCTTVVPLDGSTTALPRPPSSPGLATTTLSFLRLTPQPRISPSAPPSPPPPPPPPPSTPRPSRPPPPAHHAEGRELDLGVWLEDDDRVIEECDGGVSARAGADEIALLHERVRDRADVGGRTVPQLDRALEDGEVAAGRDDCALREQEAD